MSSILDGLFSKDEQKKLAEFSRKAKKGLGSLPVISVIGDTVQGASGLGELQQKLKDEPNDPKNWLYYYEAFQYYRKLNMKVSIGRGVVNPIGFIAGKGISKGLNTLDDEFQSFDPKKCLGVTIALSMKKVKDENSQLKAEDLVVLAKALAYSSSYANDINQQKKMLNYAINYVSRAIQVENLHERKGEYFFYLSQFYEMAGNEKLKLKALNISRKLGFEPADELLKTILKKNMTDNIERQKIDETRTNTPYKTFLLTYQHNLDSQLENTWKHVKEQQQKKLSITGKRIGAFLEKHF
ncbi:hypothetical protein [Bacillus timonensis]|uniref:hypothetical protein n=1 Tax=Bacillus timonensis TaxID=1033734 RepID=UPI000289BBD6|nr:hypothetical protein [Bacillus timonensis]